MIGWPLFFSPYYPAAKGQAMISLLAAADVALWLGAPLVALAYDWNSRRKTAPAQIQAFQSSNLPSNPSPTPRAPETLSLAALLNLANSHYPDGWLAEYFDPVTGERKAGSGDTLAQFIVIEISETFVPEASTSEQLDEARRVLLRGIDDLHCVIQAFDAYEQRPR